jgi:hypothetical protein
MITDEMREHKNIIRYQVDNFDILFQNGDVENIIGDMVTHLYIEKEYDDLYFPIVNLSVNMKDELYHRICKENDTVKFRLRVVQNIYDKDYNFLKYELYFNEVFECFKDKENIIEENKVVETKTKGEGEGSVSLGNNIRNFYLFTDEILKCKKFFNLVIESATLSDLVIYLIGDAGIKVLLMSRLNNNPTLSNYMLPSGNLIDCINFLNNNKMFYKKGMQLFFDITTAYLLDMNYECTAWRKNEIRITHIHVSDQESNDSQLNGYYIDKDRKQTHVFTHTDRLKIKNTNIVTNQLAGNKVKIIDAKNGSNQQIDPNITTVGSTNEHLLMIKDGNSYASTELKTRFEENECICGVTLIGIDTEVFSPNKEVIVTYEDPDLNKKYGGNYRIVKSTTALTKDASELIGEVNVILKKQK